MSARAYGILLSIGGLLGFFASFTLVLERLAVYANPDHVSKCDINPLFSCTSITQTWQASLFGFPNPLIGVVAFTVAIMLGVLIATGVKIPKWVHLGFLGGITLGLIFILWLVSQAVFVIGLLCLYCMVVWAVVTVLFFATLQHLLVEGHLLGWKSQESRERLADWWWVGAAIVAMIISLLVVLQLVL